jgi:WD40 repeat protein
MKRAGIAVVSLLLFSASQAQDKQLVLLAAHRVGRIEVLDPITLAQIGSIVVLPMADGIASNPDGRILYIREGVAPDFKGCCALYALDLETRRMSRLVEPSGGVTVSPDGNYVLTQPGNVGIEVYNGRTFERETSVPRSVAPGMYGLSFSPDGHLLFGATNWQQPSLDIFDFASRQLARRYPVSGDVALLGAWLRDDFYLYAYQGADGQLWRVNPQDKTLGMPVKISFPDAAPACPIHDERLFGAGKRIFLYEAFGSKADRRPKCPSVPGGVLSIDPQTGNVSHLLAGDVHFDSLVPNPDGKELYGIDVRHPDWDSVGLVRLDAETGRLLRRRELSPDVWYIHLASLPRKLVPHGEVEAVHD